MFSIARRFVEVANATYGEQFTELAEGLKQRVSVFNTIGDNAKLGLHVKEEEGPTSKVISLYGEERGDAEPADAIAQIVLLKDVPGRPSDRIPLFGRIARETEKINTQGVEVMHGFAAIDTSMGFHLNLDKEGPSQVLLRRAAPAPAA